MRKKGKFVNRLMPLAFPTTISRRFVFDGVPKISLYKHEISLRRVKFRKSLFGTLIYIFCSVQKILYGTLFTFFFSKI